MRPRKKDDNNPEGDFPPPEWFAEIDTYFYPKLPPLYYHLLRPDGQLFKLLKAKKVQNVKHPVMYGCFICKRWLQPDQVDDHLAGKTHVVGITQIQHTYELIKIEHEWFDVFFKHLAKRPPPFSIQAMRRQLPFHKSSPPPILLPTLVSNWTPGKPEDGLRPPGTDEPFENVSKLPTINSVPMVVSKEVTKPSPTPVPAQTVGKPPDLTKPPPTFSKSPVLTKPPPSISKPPVLTQPAPTISKSPVLSKPAPTVSKPAVLTKPAPTVSKPPVLTQPPTSMSQLPQNTSQPPPSLSQPPVLSKPTAMSVEPVPGKTKPAVLPVPAPITKTPPKVFSTPTVTKPSKTEFSTSSFNGKKFPQPVSSNSSTQPIYVPPPLRTNSPKKQMGGVGLPKPVCALPKPVSAKSGSPQVDGNILSDKVANIQGFMDKCRDKAFIGLEYVVEVQHEDMNLGDWYSCRLCDILYNPKEGGPCIDMMRQHLSMNSHKIRYLSRHFPTIYEYKLETPNNSVIAGIVNTVEKCYGRLKVRVVSGKKNYKDNLDYINKTIEEGEHFIEEQGIVDIVLKRKPEPSTHALDTLTPDNQASYKQSTEEAPKAITESEKKENSDLKDETVRKEESNIKKVNNDPDEKKENKVKVEKVRAKSRSLSPISDTENDALIPKEEKRAVLRKEREQRVQAFKDAEATMIAALDMLKESFTDDPTQHPDYSREWSEFWRQKSSELRSRGIRPQDYDMKPEWIIKWSTLFETDFANRRRKERDSLMRKHKLLPRDLEEFQKKTEAKPERSVSLSLSPISDTESKSRSSNYGDGYRCETKVLTRHNKWSPERSRRDSVPGRHRQDLGPDESPPRRLQSHEQPRRSASPWEEDDFPTSSSSDRKRPSHDWQGRSPQKSRKIESRSPPRRSWSRNSRTPQHSQRSLSPFSKRSDHNNTSASGDIDLRSRNIDLRNRSRSPHDIDLRRNGSPPQRRDKRSPFSQRSGGSYKTRDSKEESHEVSVIGTLRLMSALDQAGLIRDLGKQLDQLLGKAIVLENKVPESSWDMLHEKDCFQLFTTTKDRVMQVIKAGSLSESESKVCRIILDSLIILLQRSSLTLQDIQEKQHPAPQVSEDQRLIKMAIARTIDQQLRAEGRRLNQQEFNALVEAEYIRVKHQLPSQIMQDKPQHPAQSRPPSQHTAMQQEIHPRNPWTYDNSQIGLMSQQQRSGPGHNGPASIQSNRFPGQQNYSEQRQEPNQLNPQRGFEQQNAYHQQESNGLARVQDYSRLAVSSPLTGESWNNREPPMQVSASLGRESTFNSGSNSSNPTPTKAVSTISDSGSAGFDQQQSAGPTVPISQSESFPAPTGQSAAAPVSIINQSSAIHAEPSQSVAPLNIDFNLLSNIMKTVKGSKKPLASQSIHSNQQMHSENSQNPSENPQMHSENHQSVQNLPASVAEEEEEEFYADFTDEELISLLRNFKSLEPLEQKDLISHMKKLERDEPDRVQRLKEAVHKK